MPTNKPVVFIVASADYQPIEYQIPKHLIEQAGYAVLTASDKTGTITAHDGSHAQADLLLEHVNPENFQAVVFIGGPGVLEHLDNKISYDLLKKAEEKKLIIGSICLSTRILAKSGILKDTCATGWNGDKELDSLYAEYKVRYKPNDVVVDENIVTAVGPAAAREFAENIISLLTEKNRE